MKINNFGFVSDFDYDPHEDSPLLAVIGDSFVAAFMVPYRETCAGRLAARLHGTARVYSFGAAYSALSQYLGYAEYVRDTFRPAGLVIVIIENDYDQSLRKYGLRQGMYQFVERAWRPSSCWRGPTPTSAFGTGWSGHRRWPGT